MSITVQRVNSLFKGLWPLFVIQVVLLLKPSRDICRILKKKRGTDELIYKTEKCSEMQKTNLWLLGLKRVWINWEIGIDIYTLLYVKQITNKDLLYSTGNSTRYSIMAYMEKNLKQSGYMYMQNWTWNNRLVPNRKRSTSKLYIVTLLI